MEEKKEALSEGSSGNPGRPGMKDYRSLFSDGPVIAATIAEGGYRLSAGEEAEHGPAVELKKELSKKK